MIINIPLTLDEHVFEEKIQNDYDKIIKNEIINCVTRTLERESRSYYGDSKDGMKRIIEDQVGVMLEENRDDIIEKAGAKLADRLSRTKKAKAILEDMETK